MQVFLCFLRNYSWFVQPCIYIWINGGQAQVKSFGVCISIFNWIWYGCCRWCICYRLYEFFAGGSFLAGVLHIYPQSSRMLFSPHWTYLDEHYYLSISEQFLICRRINFSMMVIMMVNDSFRSEGCI